MRRHPCLQRHAPWVVALAAVELADYVEKMCGVRPAIRTESARGENLTTRIFIGPCKATGERVKAAALLPEEFLIRTEGDDLFIVGGDVAPGDEPWKGTLFGVYDFIERELGVRWLFPGEHGEAVPKRKTIAIGELNRREQPRVEKRKVRNVAVSREEIFRPVLAQ